MNTLHALLRRCREFGRGACPACNARAGSPLCETCRTQSAVSCRPVTTSLGPHVMHFVGSYRREAGRDGHGLSPLGRSLRAFKDHGDRYAGRCLASLFAASCAPLVAGLDIIVPVPSDVSRLRERGLGPAAWLAHGLARRSDVALRTGALRRVPGLPPQRGLSGAARRSNARGAFRLGDGPLRGYSIALVDDVVTTGATLREAARCLDDAGAARVVCVALACADEEVIAACRSRTGSAGTRATASSLR